MVSSTEHYGALLNAVFDYKHYMQTLRENSLNLMRVFTGTYVEWPGYYDIKGNSLAPQPGQFLSSWARSETPGYPGGGNLFDFSHFNPVYFGRLKKKCTVSCRCAKQVFSDIRRQKPTGYFRGHSRFRLGGYRP